MLAFSLGGIAICIFQENNICTDSVLKFSNLLWSVLFKFMPCLSVGSNFFFLYVQIVLDKFKLVWTGPICFRPDQKQLFTTEVHMAKTYGLVQNNLDLTNIALELTLSQPWGGHIMPPHHYWHPRIFRPSYGPQYVCVVIMQPQSDLTASCLTSVPV